MSESWSRHDRVCAIWLLIAFGLSVALVVATVVMSIRVYPAPLGNLPYAWRVCTIVDVLLIGGVMVMIVKDPDRTVKGRPGPSWGEAAKTALWYWLGISVGQVLTFAVSRNTDRLWLTLGLMPLAYLVLLIAFRSMRPWGSVKAATTDE